MKVIQENPDFIIWNGDNGAHMHLNDSDFFDAIKNVSKVLKETFPSTNILPSLGNHDVNPSNDMVENSTWCEKLFSFWEFFFNNSTKEMASFKHGCFYSRIVKLQNESVKVIVLNTIIWYNNNAVRNNSKDPYGQFKWMMSELEDAKHNHHKVFVAGHVPPGASEYAPQKFKHLRPEFNDWLYKILQNYSDIIEAGFFAHQHTDSFKVVYDIKGKPVIPLFISPSVTPYHLWGLGSVNPSIRLFSWSRNESRRHYLQYHTKLPDIQQTTDLEWSLEYNSTVLMPSLSAAQLDSLLTDLSSNNSLYFPMYFEYHLSGRPHDYNETCAMHSACRCTILCGMRYILYPDLDQCLTKCPSDYTVAIVFGSLFAALLLIVVVSLAVYCYRRRKVISSNGYSMTAHNGDNYQQIVSDPAIGNSRTLLNF